MTALRSFNFMDIEKLTALALADTMLATDGSPENLVAACTRVFAASQPWAPGICMALALRTGVNFHYFSRHELADILLELLGRGCVDFDEDEDGVDSGDGREQFGRRCGAIASISRYARQSRRGLPHSRYRNCQRLATWPPC